MTLESEILEIFLGHSSKCCRFCYSKNLKMRSYRLIEPGFLDNLFYQSSTMRSILGLMDALDYNEAARRRVEREGGVDLEYYCIQCRKIDHFYESSDEMQKFINEYYDINSIESLSVFTVIGVTEPQKCPFCQEEGRIRKLNASQWECEVCGYKISK
jgi:rubrerythrin